jgi:hypothetical protein
MRRDVPREVVSDLRTGRRQPEPEAVIDSGFLATECDSLNRVKSCLLASSFLARAAAVSKVNRAGFLSGSIRRAVSVALAFLPMLEPDVNKWSELDV